MSIITLEDERMVQEIEKRYKQAKELCSDFTLQLPHTFQHLFDAAVTGWVNSYKDVKVKFVKPTLKQQVDKWFLEAQDQAWQARNTAHSGLYVGRMNAFSEVLTLINRQELGL